MKPRPCPARSLGRLQARRSSSAVICATRDLLDRGHELQLRRQRDVCCDAGALGAQGSLATCPPLPAPCRRLDVRVARHRGASRFRRRLRRGLASSSRFSAVLHTSATYRKASRSSPRHERDCAGNTRSPSLIDVRRRPVLLALDEQLQHPRPPGARPGLLGGGATIRSLIRRFLHEPPASGWRVLTGGAIPGRAEATTERRSGRELRGGRRDDFTVPAGGRRGGSGKNKERARAVRRPRVSVRTALLT